MNKKLRLPRRCVIVKYSKKSNCNYIQKKEHHQSTFYNYDLTTILVIKKMMNFKIYFCLLTFIILTSITFTHKTNRHKKTFKQICFLEGF